MSGKFTGFSVASTYPIYTVRLPQTGMSLDVRGITLAEYTKIKESIITKNRTPELADRMIYDCIINKPSTIDTYELFLKNITVLDRDAILYGIFIQTYGKTRKYELQCGNEDCNEPKKVAIDITKCFNINNYPNAESMVKSYVVSRNTGEIIPDPIMEKVISEDPFAGVKQPPEGMPAELAKESGDYEEYFKILNEIKQKSDTSENTEDNKDTIVDNEDLSYDIIKKRVEIILPVSNLRVTIRQPTLFHEIESFQNFTLSRDTEFEFVTQTMIIESMAEHDHDGNVLQCITDRGDIILALRNLIVKDSDFIYAQYDELFGQYGLKLETTWPCEICEFTNRINIEMTSHFFRALDSRGEAVE